MASIEEEANNIHQKQQPSSTIGRAQQQNKVPSALRPLLEAFARETLRSQPTDLVKFGCCFFNTLDKHCEIKTPNGIENLLSGNKSAYNLFRINLQENFQLITKTANSNLTKNGGGGGGSPVNCSRRHNNQQRPNSPMDIAATKIQAAFRGHFLRSHPEKFGLDSTKINGICQRQRMRRNSNERLALFDNRKDLKRHSVGGYSHAQQLTASPEDRAATKIQAEIRGYLTRKHIEDEKKQNQTAATKIQAHIRGYLTRKHLEEKGVLVSPPRSRTSTNARSEMKNGIDF
uniref:RIIa domain-containing protein n=1 Tax=Meloidogyne incognita TaxID=6306 RepID=A0A914MH90_MELIC